MKKLTILLAFFIVTAFSIEATAQEAPTSNKGGLGPRFGFYKAPDAEDGTMFIGAQFRSRGKSVFGGEFAIEYRGEQTYDISGGEMTVRQIPVTGSVLVFVPVAPNFQPYGLAGLGAYYSLYDYDGTFSSSNDAEVNIGYHLGFGLDVPVTANAALNVDYRYLFLEGNNDNLGDKEYSGNVLTGGLTFYF